MKPIPKPSYLDQCEYLGFVHGTRRWRSEDGQRLFEWDPFHGEIEVYNKRGAHMAVYDHTGKLIKPPVKGRRIDV